MSNEIHELQIAELTDDELDSVAGSLFGFHVESTLEEYLNTTLTDVLTSGH